MLVFIVQGCRAASQDVITELTQVVSIFLKFRKCKCLHVKMASLATVNSCVTIAPLS